MNKQEQMQELSNKLFKELQKGEELEIIYYSKEDCLTRFANNSITQNVDQRENFITLRLKKGKKFINLTSNSTNFDSLKTLIKKGREDIEYIQDAPDIPELLEGPQQYEKILSYNTKIANFSAEDRSAIVQKTVNISKKQECEANGTVSNTSEVTFIANSNSLSAYFENTFFSFRYIPKYKDVTSFNAFNATSLEKFNLEGIITDAIELAKQSVNPQDAEEGAYTVIFSPHAVTNFLEFLSWFGFNTKNIYEKSVILWNKINEKIFSEQITMYDDFREEDFIGIPFDVEGTPRKKVIIVENGIFKATPLSRRYAKLLNKESSTGHNLIVEPNMQGVFPINLIVKNGKNSLDELIKSTDDGIYVHNLHYCNVLDQYKLLLTGLTRFGVFRIKNGKLAHPLKNMRFTESITNIFNNVVETASESYVLRAFFGAGFKTPGMKVQRFNFSSKTLF